MTSLFQECSLLQQINKTEESIRTCYDRIETLERKLRTKVFPPDHEEVVEKELVECRKLLRTNEKILSTLHKSNRGTFMFGVALCLICFLVWMLYILVNGADF